MIGFDEIVKILEEGNSVDKSDAVPIYIQLVNILKAFITEYSHELEVLPKEIELCNLFSVSRDSMNKAMSLLVEEGYVVRIKRKGTFVNKEKFINELEKSRLSTQLGVIWPRNSNWGEALTGIEEEVRKKGFKTRICAYDWHRNDDEIALLEELSTSCAGIVLYPNCDGSDASYIKRLKALGYPLVLFDIKPEGTDMPLVTCANVDGSYDIVNHMLDNGYKRIAYIGNARHFSTIQGRYEGYKKAVGSLYNEELVYFRPDNMDTYQAYKDVERFLGEVKPDSAFCADHGMVISCLRYAATHKLRIPDDFGITAFDNYPEDEFLSAPLTVIEQPLLDMGRKAGSVLAHIIENGNVDASVYEVPVRMLVRKSASRSVIKQ